MNIMDFARVQRAYDAVRSGIVNVVPFPQIASIYREAYVTEFFTRDQTITVERIEAAQLAA